MSGEEIRPVILSGGSGTRLWPLSRANYPKQFLCLDGNRTLLQDTVSRISSEKFYAPVLVCNEEHRFLAAEQLRELDVAAEIILEPAGRNTAPAIAIAALLEVSADPLLLVLPADHVIKDNTSFMNAVKTAVPLAAEGRLVTFGARPQSAHTGYGYIQRGESVEGGYEVDKFFEKPTKGLAEKYASDPQYLWNCGIFLFKASAYLTELRRFRPEICQYCEESVHKKTIDKDFIRIDSTSFSSCESESVDYAIFENSDKVCVVELDAGWSDVGSWGGLGEVNTTDQHGNVARGDVILEQTVNSIVWSDDKLVSVIGARDLVVVSTKDALLVADRKASEGVKGIVERLKREGRSEWHSHKEVFRPWGKFVALEGGDGFQVKRITVNPGAKLSLQMHHHRAEHWVVVSGCAKVINGDEEFLLSENQSTYIACGVVHCLENPGILPLELIEIQSGSYLGEDDIVRLSDRYGRA